MKQQGSEVKAVKVKEIRRQKVYIPKTMTTNQVMEKYDLKPGAAYTARKQGRGSPIKGRVKRKNTSPAEKHTCFSFTLQLLSATNLSC